MSLLVLIVFYIYARSCLFGLAVKKACTTVYATLALSWQQKNMKNYTN